MSTAPSHPFEPNLTKLPPELAAEKDSLVDCYLEAIDYAERSLRYRPAHLARDVVHQAFLELTTTHRWDKRKGELRMWFLLLVRNEINEVFKTGDRIIDRKTGAEYRRHEVQATADQTLDAEQLMILREEAEDEERQAPLRGALLDAIKASVAHNAVATGIIEAWEEEESDLKPQQLAERLGVSRNQIYLAKDVIQYQAEKCRERLGKHGDKS